MDTTRLKNFAQKARVDLIQQVTSRVNVVLAPESLERREHPTEVFELEKKVTESGKSGVVDEVAYTWFNRFCAIRFMDVNNYNKERIVSPVDGQFLPEILQDAKQGIFNDDVIDLEDQNTIKRLLSGALQSRDAQGEAYRILFVSYCNHLSTSMPYLFEEIDDYTELLLPSGLLSANSVLSECRNVLTAETCEDVEVIGWLYQYYISEKKDEVFKNFKKGKKAGPKEIPAATQLFTPHWIVRYLVENSLGRLWMLNNPSSRLIERMEYYIKPEQTEDEFLKINKPEEIKVCDPACGSGHMLTYAFELLYAIYEEEGYTPSSISKLILEHNLYGIEIDKRAGELAAFALTMKARAKSRRFFNSPVEPNIKVLENIKIAQNDLNEYMEHVGRDLFTREVIDTINQFAEADNLGSLIIPKTKKAEQLLSILSEKNMKNEMFLQDTHENVLKALEQAVYLSQRYHVVVANPPYMGGGVMNPKLSDFAKKNYPNSKSDMCTMFIERNLNLAIKQGAVAMITMQSWMFLSSFEKLRATLIDDTTISTMAHLGARAFDSIGGEVVSTTAFIIKNKHGSDRIGSYVRLVDGNSESEKYQSLKEAINNPDCGWFYRVSADEFQKIPGSPIAYWLSPQVYAIFKTYAPLNNYGIAASGIQTSNNEKYLRYWNEISFNNLLLNGKDISNVPIYQYWLPHNKGGEFRRWYGNHNYVLNWKNNGKYAKNDKKFQEKNMDLQMKEAVTWSHTSSGSFSVRYSPKGFSFNVEGPIFLHNSDIEFSLGFLGSKVSLILMGILSPHLHFLVGAVQRLPLCESFFLGTVRRLITISNFDWDSYETSWDFTSLPLLDTRYRQATLADTYHTLRTHWTEMTLEMQRLEEENNRIFIEAYGLEDELTPEVPLKEITLTCNPHYRYGDNKSPEELESLLLADTMKEFISYAVGCMFGRYSLDKPGLILANQGETVDDYLAQVPKPSFYPDEDNAIPILDGEWFSDDIVSRFRKFLRVTFGDEHYEENLRFIENAIGKDIRKYFLKDFYNDHVKRYKKRPIYWMFSSPDGNFNVLIYMHRYKPDTVSIVLNEYLRQHQIKLENHMVSLRDVESNPNATKGEKTRSLKEITRLHKTLDTLKAWERDVIFPLATQKIEIDLDDGVKVNYPKFGTALKKVTGLESKKEA